MPDALFALPDSIDLAIVGAGSHALALLQHSGSLNTVQTPEKGYGEVLLPFVACFRLAVFCAALLVTHFLQKKQSMRGWFLVFIPSGTWLSRWNHQFATLEIPHW